MVLNLKLSPLSITISVGSGITIRPPESEEVGAITFNGDEKKYKGELKSKSGGGGQRLISNKCCAQPGPARRGYFFSTRHIQEKASFFQNPVVISDCHFSFPVINSKWAENRKIGKINSTRIFT